MRSGEIGLAKQVYALGEELTGSLHISLKKPLSERSAIISLIGKERTQVEYSTGKGVATAVQESEFLHNDFPIDLPPGEERKIRAGDYDIPFRFALPQGLPVSFKGNRVRVVYAVFAKINVPRWFDMKESTEFNVFSSEALHIESQPTSAFSDSWKNPRDTGIAFTIDRCQFRRGEVLGGECTFRNPNWEDLRKIDVSLTYFETVTARGHTAYSDIAKATSQITFGSKPGRIAMPFSIRIPEDVPPSYKSSLSSIGYVLNLEVDAAHGSDIVASQTIDVFP